MQRRLEAEVMDTEAEAVDYDRMDHSEPNEAFVARLIELGACGRMLDIGTGPGHIPLLVCERIRDAEVLGVDLADAMLAIAERRRRASAHRERLRYERADACALPYADGAFDAVFSNTILHHIPDPRPFLREAWRVLRPGGAFLIRDLYRPSDEARLEELVRLHAGGSNAHQQAMFRDSLMAALTPAELRALLREIDLNDLELTVDTDRHMSLQRAARLPS